MQTKTVLILLAATAFISASITRYYWPKIQIQTNEVTKEIVRTDIHTVTKLVERPDGTKETITDTTDHSTANSSASKSTIVVAQKNWILSTSIGTELSQYKPVYGLQAQRRILGPIYVGGLLSTTGMVGLSLGFEL